MERENKKKRKGKSFLEKDHLGKKNEERKKGKEKRTKSREKT